MNQLFSFQRFIWLVQKHWSDHGKKYGMSLLVIAGALALWFTLTILGNRSDAMSKDIQGATYYFGLFVIGAIYTSIVFADLNEKAKAISFLSLPASHLEKIVTGLFYSLILFFICYTVVFYVIDFCFVPIGNFFAANEWKTSTNFEPKKVVNVFTTLKGAERYLLFGYFACQAFFFLGAIYFTKFNFIKTFLLGCLLLILAVFYITMLAKQLNETDPQLSSQNLFEFSKFNEGDGQKRIYGLPGWASMALTLLAQYAVAPVLWFIAFVRMKEKQV
jgi:hypothetical protein